MECFSLGNCIQSTTTGTVLVNIVPINYVHDAHWGLRSGAEITSSDAKRKCQVEPFRAGWANIKKTTKQKQHREKKQLWRKYQKQKEKKRS